MFKRRKPAPTTFASIVKRNSGTIIGVSLAAIGAAATATVTLVMDRRRTAREAETATRRKQAERDGAAAGMDADTSTLEDVCTALSQETDPRNQAMLVDHLLATLRHPAR